MPQHGGFVLSPPPELRLLETGRLAETQGIIKNLASLFARFQGEGTRFMCGIAGWYRRGNRPVNPAIIHAQCDTIAHRGPDDAGILTDGDFGFGMRRLSILDLAGGHQPMETEDGRYAIVFNGEIFNHIELRQLLGDYAFRNKSDTETILAAFSTWGNDAWRKLEGMFAVAIWDRRQRELTLARDPLGIKPLYVSQQFGGLAFGSELKALRRLPELNFDVDDRAVHDYFSFGHVRRPRSIFRQVVTLDPGHYLTIGPKGDATAKAFWRPAICHDQRMSSAEWIDQMRSMLLETTNRHMQSDVSVGAFLSGGIDSSAVLAAMRHATDRPLKAFTIGYPGSHIDETDAARRVAEHLGCEHVVMALELPDAKDALPTVLAAYDEPFADMAAIPTWYASKMASEHVKVVLCGEGGDELFAGYKRHRNANAIERGRPLIDAFRPLGAIIDYIPATRSQRLNYLRQHAQRFAEFIRLPDGYQQFFAATQISCSGVRRKLYDADFWENQEGEGAYSRLEQEYFGSGGGQANSALEKFLYADLTLNMPSAMLTRLDRGSMAHSLEARVPFLSHKMVDWALGVPTELKLKGRMGKAILRQAVAPWLPADVLARPKQGFQIPHAHWLRGDFGRYARELWNDGGVAEAGYLDPVYVECLFDEHSRGIADHGRTLYAIAAFSLWWSTSRLDLAGQTVDAA